MKNPPLDSSGRWAGRHVLSLLALGVSLLLTRVPSRAAQPAWVGTWATSPMMENTDAMTPALADATLRQVVRISTGGKRLRLRLSNAFGRSELAVTSAVFGLAADGSAKAVPLSFGGRPGVVVPAGAVMLSDAAELLLPPMADVEVTLQFKKVPEAITGHPGARATSRWRKTAGARADNWAQAAAMTRWYFITGIEVETERTPRAVVLLGDSITDGYGVMPGTHQRWTDELSRRFRGNPATADIGVLNHGIGGNRLLRDGVGPNMLARFDRDVLVQSGVRWVIVQAGINDIGTRLEARKRGDPFASAEEIISAYVQLIERAHLQGLRIIGTTLTPYAGANFYWSADGEADRQAINRWIRTSGHFDAVIDFDEALRDAGKPERLAPAFDSGDHLHPSMAGYAEMARVVDMGLFTAP